MSDFDRCLPPPDRQEEPEPMPPESFSRRLERLARERYPKEMARADALAAEEATLRWKRCGAADDIASARRVLTENSAASAELVRAVDSLPPMVSREPGEDG